MANSILAPNPGAGSTGSWLLTPDRDPSKAARGVAWAQRDPDSYGNVALIYEANWQWLTDLLAKLPAQSGRLLLQLETGRTNPYYPVEEPITVRLTRKRQFWHRRQRTTKEGITRTQWKREPYFVTEKGLWVCMNRPKGEPVLRRYPEALVDWLERLQLDPIGVLSDAGRSNCECAICGRPLRDLGEARGIGPECIRLFEVL